MRPSRLSGLHDRSRSTSGASACLRMLVPPMGSQRGVRRATRAIVSPRIELRRVSPDAQAFTRLFARWRYCSRFGRGGSGDGIRATGLHTNLLSRDRLGVRTGQAERRFRDVESNRLGGHGPFRGLDAPLALRSPYRRTNARGRRQAGTASRIDDVCHPERERGIFSTATRGWSTHEDRTGDPSSRQFAAPRDDRGGACSRLSG